VWSNLDVRVWFWVQLDDSIFPTISEILIFNDEKQLFYSLHCVAFAAYFGLP